MAPYRLNLRTFTLYVSIIDNVMTRRWRDNISVSHLGYRFLL